MPCPADEVHFIDYEYGNYSYRGFDIGNHFCEFAGGSIIIMPCHAMHVVR
jgi:hypothetical protein